MRKGFTLTEILIVVVIIGILASFAIPTYLRATERAKVGKGKHALSLIVHAEKMYEADHAAYVAFVNADLENRNFALNDYVELKELVNDPDWDFSAVADAVSFTATATRTAGSSRYNGQTLVIDEKGDWSASTHELSGFKEKEE